MNEYLSSNNRMKPNFVVMKNISLSYKIYAVAIVMQKCPFIKCTTIASTCMINRERKLMSGASHTIDARYERTFAMIYASCKSCKTRKVISSISEIWQFRITRSLKNKSGEDYLDLTHTMLNLRIHIESEREESTSVAPDVAKVVCSKDSFCLMKSKIRIVNFISKLKNFFLLYADGMQSPSRPIQPNFLKNESLYSTNCTGHWNLVKHRSL
ncbi:hypothetical protein ALC53_09124 [Atta colombica]|uniref:Uncharacterized protein n=1 Tax=Atta colombica TaxID=520822 RepID=A0A151I1W5_9HYME|nr:hypothetical protein ALC53_09124 [Atta colombica]